MADGAYPAWKQKLVFPDKILSEIEPGMSIFPGTGVAEPRTLVKPSDGFQTDQPPRFEADTAGPMT